VTFQLPLRHEPIAGAVLRASPAFELVPFAHLPPAQLALLGDLTGDPGYYGILRPARGTGLAIKAVGHEMARLFESLRAPRVGLENRSSDDIDSPAAPQLARLVLDGVLEIETDRGFVSGPDAAPLILDSVAPPAATTATARLSLAALRYAQSLPVDDPMSLSARLYFYNRRPVSPRWRNRLTHPGAVAAFLGLDDGGPNDVRLSAQWRERSSPGDVERGWRRWRRRGIGSAGNTPGPTFKLYVSPAVDHLREALQTTIAVLSDSVADDFKVGGTEQGILRPDKIVVYFRDRDALDAVANRLTSELTGITPHGVPFSADVSGDGLISWGVDPPEAPQVLWRQGESWRLWVTNRLATALLAARRSAAQAVEPWQFAVARVRLDGVDPETWAPDPSAWAGMVGTAS
jgi:hypothetical protein